MPMIVAAAGAVTGAYVGGVLQKEFGGPQGQPIQIDPSESMTLLSQATAENNYYDTIGLGTYTNEINNARNEINSNYANAIATLQPSSQASQAAINEMMKFMGMTPIQPTANIPTQLQGLQLSGDTSGLYQLINEANSATDPAQRAQLKQQVIDAINNTPIQDNTQSAIAELGPMPTYAYAGVKNATPIVTQANPSLPTSSQINGYNALFPGSGAALNAAISNVPTTVTTGGKPIVDAGPQPKTNVPILSMNSPTGNYKQGINESARQDMINQANATYQQELAVWKNQVAQTTEEQQQAYQQATNQKNAIAEQFAQNYTPQFQSAYTGDQVTKAIESTPGYQSTLDLGTQAAERTAAAQGMLSSGNTLSALTQYGQNLALQYFNSHMQNLANIANAGAGATQALASTQAGLGGALAQLNTIQGSADLATYQNMGQVASQNTASAAQIAYNADEFNANVLLKNQQMNEQLAQQAIQSGPAQSQANLANNIFNYQVAQNQQGGQAYLSGNSSASV